MARKISVKQSDVVSFLLNQNISIADNSNTRVEEEQIRLVVQHFAPNQINEIFTEVEKETPTAEKEETKIDAHSELVYTVALPNNEIKTEEFPEQQQPIEVIKAPKVELQGLKIVGKIDLPEAPKKETKEQRQENKQERQRRESRQTERKGGKRNPIALQREREEREAQLLREEKLKAEKELKTKRYLSKVKPRTVKPTRLVKEEVEQMVEVAEQQPTNIFGRFWRWLRT
ncbi:MAG: hypothetical protein ACKO96_27165 [Flammeovirgaceae bacterium]